MKSIIASRSLSSHFLTVPPLHLGRMEPSNKYIPTPEQILLSKARKEKKADKLLAAKANASDSILSRPWLTLHHDQSTSIESPDICKVKIMTWNLLAQCLIRRELFPTSDCLKAGQRGPLITQEIVRQNADIICLQEVDRLEKLLPVLEDAGYSHHYTSGPRKLHGCLIGYKKELYSMVSDRTVFYDDQLLELDAQSPRIGSSFKTRNIGYLMALRSNINPKKGVTVATTHLFWHPRYTYERIRQLGILLREVSAFRTELSLQDWPCVIAGDFNFSPNDPAYSLLTGDTLLSTQKEMIEISRVVHASLDPTILANAPVSVTEEDAEDVDPDRVITNARPSTTEDGLLTTPELENWFSNLPTPRSAYNDGIHTARERGNSLPTYSTRTGLPTGRNGSDEPEFTSYTHYWQSVLDYIFFLEPTDRPVNVVGLLTPLKEPDLVPGLPQKRVSGSDHVCLVAELSW